MRPSPVIVGTANFAGTVYVVLEWYTESVRYVQLPGGRMPLLAACSSEEAGEDNHLVEGMQSWRGHGLD